jgi:hypothetical protein
MHQLAIASTRAFHPRLAAFASFLILSLALYAQNTTGRVIGTVSDAKGAVIVDAKVIVTNTSTNQQWQTVTGSEGAYQVIELPIGSYSVAVEHKGFKKLITAPQPLDINQSLRIDVRLEVGALQEVVTVHSEAPQVETVNPAIGGTVTGATIQNLPLNGRDTLDLALTQAGITPSAGASQPSGKFSIGGGRDDSVTYILNGGNNTSVTFGLPVMDPNPDSVAEFRILLNNYTAEYGRSAGGVISVETKSGTNFFHGSLFDYLRNDAFNANAYFNDQTGQPRPVLKRNQFGGTIGGPISLPKLVNGLDRFFFFFGYQGQRQNSVLVGNAITTYTPAELTGDFSHSLTVGPDPGVVAFLQSHPYFVAPGRSAQNGIIDPTKINPVAQGYIRLGLVPTSPRGVIVPNGTASDNQDEYTGKFDFVVTNKDQVSLTLSKFHNPAVSPFFVSQPLVPDVPGAPVLNQNDNYFANAAYLRTISPNILDEFHITAQRSDAIEFAHARNDLPGPTGLGITGTSVPTNGPPLIVLNSSGLQFGFPPLLANSVDNTYVYSDTLTWTKGRHTWKAGASFAFVENNVKSPIFASVFNLYGGAASIGSGNDRADFLLGVAGDYEDFPNTVAYTRSHQYAGFFQDEWRMTPRLVLTLGIRYEYNSPKTDTAGRQYEVIPGLQSKRFPLAPLGLVFPGDPGVPSGSYFPDRKNWAPRFGFAWDPLGNGKTSLRGGFGVFYDVLLALDNQFQAGTPPFYSAAALPFSPSNIPANGPIPIMSDPFGSAGIANSSSLPSPQNLDFVAAGLIPFGYPASNFIDPHLRTPYTYQYNLSLERQIGKGLAAEVGYVGRSSHKLTTQVDENPMIVGTGQRILNSKPVLQDFEGGGSPAFGAILTNANAVTASYNGLLASLNKRMGDWHSLGQSFFTLSYTWAHEVDDASGLFRNTFQVPFFDHHQFRASGDSDIRNRLVLSGGWELPFARLWSRGPKRLTSGWTLYPIAFYQSGLPIDVNAGLPGPAGGPFVPGPSGVGDSNLARPDWTGGAPTSLNPNQIRTINGNTGNFAFDPSDLVVPQCYSSSAAPGTPGGCPQPTYGTLSRNFFRGPGRFNLDLSLEKKIKLIGERLQMAFRVEFFNILNHPEFQNPVGGPVVVSSPQVGQVTSTYDPRVGQLALRFTF